MKPGRPAPSALLSLGGAFFLLSAVTWAALRSPRVPYNVRELSEGRPPFMTAALLSLVLLATFGAPAWIASVALRGRSSTGRTLPLVLLAQAALVWLLLRVTVPVEALHDIVGFPVLGASHEAETAGRFLALLLGVATLLLGAAAAWIAWEEKDKGPLVRWAVIAAVALPLSYVVVVPFAATDNLVELMRGGGGVLSAATLGAAVASVGIAGSGLSRLLAGRARSPIAPIGIAILALPVGYGLLHLGLEPAVEKYGRTFSALQFLLSEDRTHLASGKALHVRYTLAFLVGAATIAITQHAAWLASTRSRIRPSLPFPARWRR